jgi:hypothetical protein
MDAQQLVEELSDRKNPRSWLTYALSHKRAAEILFEHVEAEYPDGEPVNIEDACLGLQNSAMLLLGLAVELAIKAFLLKRQIKNWEEISKVPPLSNHDLLEQYKFTSLRLSEKRQWTLRQLTAFTQWAGKYPTPKKDNQFVPLPAEFSPLGLAAQLPPISFRNFERTEVTALITEIEEMFVT